MKSRTRSSAIAGVLCLALSEMLAGCSLIDAPSPSPSSQAIAFIQFPANASYGTLALMHDDGSGIQTVPGRFWDPAFSPDGATIAVAGDSTAGSSAHITSLYLMGRDGSNRRALLSWNVVASPSWSPDGRHIAFLCSDTIPGYATHICVVGVGGDGLRRVTGREIRASHPSWSPDGSQIVFECRPGVFITSNPGYSKPPEPYTPSNVRGVCIANADSSGWRQITSASDFSPTWSWATNRIAFSRRDSLLTIVTPDGVIVQTRPTPEFSSALSPTWSPDGRRLAFVGEKWTVRGDVGVYLDVNSIYVADLANGKLTRLTRGVDASAPAWSVH